MSSATMEPIAVAKPETPEWYAARMTGLGASEAAAACGLSRWSTPFEVYCRKKGLLTEREDNDAMRLGRRLEPIIIAEFVDRTGLEIAQAPCPMMRHPEHSFILATPDAVLTTDSPLEAKSTTWRIAKDLGEQGSDELPAEWVMQTQQQILVMDVELAHVAVLIDGRTLKTFEVERNDRLIARMIEVEAELWDRIQRDDPPPPDFTHRSTPDLIKHLYGLTSGKTIVLPADVAELCVADDAAALAEKEAKATRDTLRAKILHAMGDAEIGLLPDFEMEMVRREITRKEYTVKETTYVTLTKRKAK